MNSKELIKINFELKHFLSNTLYESKIKHEKYKDTPTQILKHANL